MLAPVARLLIAAERRAWVPRRIVHIDTARAHAHRHAPRARLVRGLHVGRESIGRVVRNSDRFFFVAIRHDREHGTKDFLARDRHRRRHAGEHGGLHVIAAFESIGTSFAARHQCRALLDADADQLLHAPVLHFADDGTHRRGGIAGGTHAMLPRRAQRNRHRFIVAGCGHEHARRRIARLTAVTEARVHARRYRDVEIGIVEQDVGRFAAQFLMHALDRRRSQLRYFNARARRSGERDHIDIRMRGKRRADRRAIAVDEIENAFGHTRRIDDLGEQHRIHRRHFARLEHDRAARRERGRDLADDLIDRPVPRRNERGHADRLVIHERRALLALPLEVFERAQRFLDMPLAERRLPGMR
ncbi:hypothetical protein BYI23_C009100 [Burkholderia sp. YI23]|nr:hypothetical protein BYI23_C009100 [Burkholderia sp. YI23]